VQNSEEDKKGFIAIGEAVVSHIFNREEISNDSLMQELGLRAENPASSESAIRTQQGQRLLQALPRASHTVAEPRHQTANGEMHADASIRQPGTSGRDYNHPDEQV